MEKYQLPKIINRVCAADASHILDDRGQPPLWPVNVVEALWYLGKFYPRDLYACLTQLKTRGYRQKEIARIIKQPTRLTDLFHFIEVPSVGLTTKNKIDLFEKSVNICRFLRKDPFCKNGRNEVWSKIQIQDALTNLSWHNARGNKNLRNILGRLHALMFLYAEFIWVGGRHQLSHEIHGPYDLGNGETLLVRHYYDLKPEVWPFTPSIPFEKVTLVERYKNVSIKLDCYNHLESSGQLINNLESFSLMDINTTQLYDMYEHLNKALVKGSKSVRNYSRKDWLKKAIEMQAWSLKPLKNELNLDWRLPGKYVNDLLEQEPRDEIANLFNAVDSAITKNPKEAKTNLTNFFIKNYFT